MERITNAVMSFFLFTYFTMSGTLDASQVLITSRLPRPFIPFGETYHAPQYTPGYQITRRSHKEQIIIIGQVNV